MNFQEHLKNYVEKNPRLVKRRKVGDDLFVLKYHNRVFYKNLWNRYTEVCRGTVVDGEYNPITLPFTKIYNYGIECNAPAIDDDEIVMAFRKVNGFMGAATWHDGAPLLSTTGSIDSDHVGYFREMIPEWDEFSQTLQDNPHLTFMFEVVHPSDPHIVPEELGVYLLAYREKKWGSKVGHDPGLLYAYSLRMHVTVPDHYMMSMRNLKGTARAVRHEGFVIYCADGRSSKIKSPYYLVNKFMARIKDTGRLMEDSVFDKIDEEYYPLVEHVRENLSEFSELDEQQRLNWIKNYLESDDYDA